MIPKALAKIPEGFPEALLMTFCSSSALSCPMSPLTDDCSSGGVLTEGEASNGDNDEQNRADRSNGIEGDSRSAA